MKKSIIYLLFIFVTYLNEINCYNFYQRQLDILLKKSDDLQNNNNNNNNNNNINNNDRIEFTYLGCFNDKKEERDVNERDFSYITKFNKTVPTVELCVSWCASHNFRIAAIQAL
jgi:hypothetical protein